MGKATKLNVEYFSAELKDKLEEIDNFPCTLIEAASGFGKTTAVRHFLSKKEEEGCRILAYRFLPENSVESTWAELRGVISELGGDHIEQLKTSALPGSDGVVRLGRAIQYYKGDGKVTYMFFDDYQEWGYKYAVDILEILSTHQDPDLHVIIASHTIPAEKRTKLVPNARLYHLNEEDLAFKPDDIRAYYSKAGIDIDDTQLKEVMDLTGGWAIALYLQLDTYVRSGSFQHGHMHDLMEKTVWSRISDFEKHVLLQLSLLPSFTLAQAVSISGHAKSFAEKNLREKRYFIQYSPQEGRYYFQTILKLFLSKQFELLSEDEKKQHYRVAGRLCWDGADHKRAIRFLYLSGHWEDIYELPLCVKDFNTVNEEYTVPMILDMVEHSDRELMYKHPNVPIGMMFVTFMMGQAKEIVRFAPMLRENIVNSDLPKEEKQVLEGELELLLSFLLYNRIDAIMVHHQRAWQLMKRPSRMFSPRCASTFGSPSVLFLYYRETGKLEEELSQIDECIPLYARLVSGNGTGQNTMMRAEAELNWGNYDKAEIGAYKAMFEAESTHQTSVEICGALLLSRVALLTGKKDLLPEAQERLVELTHKDDEDISRYTYDLADAYIAMLSEDYDRIRPWLKKGQIDARHLSFLVQPYAYIIYGRYLLVQKQYTKLIGVSQKAISLASVYPNILTTLYIRIYCAAAYEAMGNAKEAMLELKEAIEMGIPDKMYLPFAENYQFIKKILARFTISPDARNMIEKMAKDLSESLDSIGIAGPRLTDRELEVLELIKRGLTNGEIAKEQMVSLSTVKKQVSSILQKYGLASREQLKDY